MAAKKIPGGSWQVIVEQLESQTRLIAEGHDVLSRQIDSRIDELRRDLTTRIDDLGRVVATRADETREDLSALGERIESLEQRIERMDRPGSVH